MLVASVHSGARPPPSSLSQLLFALHLFLRCTSSSHYQRTVTVQVGHTHGSRWRDIFARILARSVRPVFAAAVKEGSCWMAPHATLHHHHQYMPKSARSLHLVYKCSFTSYLHQEQLICPTLEDYLRFGEEILSSMPCIVMAPRPVLCICQNAQNALRLLTSLSTFIIHAFYPLRSF
ncbi:hypothetical protein BKA66DRAFT_210140 [Pyrenochaeta sp. MPI-SDFR-AT-0127]|nr:hypothetical protein BKA66DRAFT_210140 [Pyrenochaeta sp. MPI-SDFR-AT-0127]